MSNEDIYKKIDTLNRVIKVNYTDVSPEDRSKLMKENSNIASKLINDLLYSLL